MHVVVGSGPAGTACAAALLARGEKVCLVDAGLTLESERQGVLARMRTQTPAEWSAVDLGTIRQGMEVSSGGVLLKRIFGSDYVYRGPAEHIAQQAAGSALMPSMARGGLSNVWGAAILPYTEGDLADWPIGAAELAPHYAAAIRLTGLAGRRDALETLFPLYGEPFALPLSRQAARFERRLEQHAERLRARGLHFGAARLAVQAPGAHGHPGCVACGLCMYGCPYDFIYHTGSTVRRWQEQEPRFRYEPGILVERVEETGAGVRLSGYRLGTREPWSMEAARAYLGAGVLPSTRIVLHSREAYEQPLTIKDSQYFLFPMLQAAGTPGVREEALYTLSQLFLELADPALGEHPVHLQLYSYSDLIGQAVKQTLGPLAWDWLRRALEGRFLIVQGYLHSRYSSRLRLALHRSAAGSGELRVVPEINPETAGRVRRVVRKLLREAATLRALPLEPFLQITPPGRGFHSGGSLPMRATPGDFETDTLGRLPGWQRIHVVDSSVFPTVPATTITLSVMANAHRIGSAVAA